MDIDDYARGYRDALAEVLMLNKTAEEPENTEPDMFDQITTETETIEQVASDETEGGVEPEEEETQP
jgi:hypothetical protein